jgi:formylglycine-generating enzyme required for sulfatase activity
MNVLVKKPIESRSYKGLLYERYPSEKLLTWNEAKEYAKNLQESSGENWRLASIEELQKLFKKENKKYIKNLQHVWSGSEESFDTAWVMDYEQNFYYLRNKDFKFRVLCVRDTILTRSIKYF